MSDSGRTIGQTCGLCHETHHENDAETCRLNLADDVERLKAERDGAIAEVREARALTARLAKIVADRDEIWTHDYGPDPEATAALEAARAAGITEGTHANRHD